jgi:hypothetical protein
MDDEDLLLRTAGPGGVVADEELQKPEQGHLLLVVSLFENILTTNSRLRTGANQSAPDHELLWAVTAQRRIPE